MTCPMRDAENGLKASNEIDKEKQVTEMASDINDCITEFVTDTGDVYIDDEATAQKMFDKGYRKQSEVVKEIFGEILSNHTPDIDGFFTMHKSELAELEKKYMEEKR